MRMIAVYGFAFLLCFRLESANAQIVYAYQIDAGECDGGHQTIEDIFTTADKKPDTTKENFIITIKPIGKADFSEAILVVERDKTPEKTNHGKLTIIKKDRTTVESTDPQFIDLYKRIVQVVEDAQVGDREGALLQECETGVCIGENYRSAPQTPIPETAAQLQYEISIARKFTPDRKFTFKLGDGILGVRARLNSNPNPSPYTSCDEFCVMSSVGDKIGDVDTTTEAFKKREDNFKAMTARLHKSISERTTETKEK